jgi:pyrimidine operon attenuation protein/uracil phosphoribosyltransferase
MSRGKRTEGLALDREILDEDGVRKALVRLADAIAKRAAGDPHPPVLLGIRTGGVVLAERLKRLVGERLKREVPLGVIDITLYRDDVFDGLSRPHVGVTDLPCPPDGRAIVLVDDVLYTGRTVRAALTELGDYGRPARVELCVLVDRGHRELPIQADHAGVTAETSRDETVIVSLSELGEPDRAAVFRKEGA